MKNTDRYSGYTDIYNIYRPKPPEALIKTLKSLRKMDKLQLVLDLGSGTGLSTRLWAPYADKVIGIEPSIDMINEAEKNTIESNVEYVKSDGHKTIFNDQCADIITASSSIHWMEPDLIVKEVIRLLKNGGVFGFYGYRYPLFVDQWQITKAYKIFKTNLDMMEIKERTAKRFSWNQHKDLLFKSKQISLVDECYFHKIISINFEDFIGWINTIGSINKLKKCGYDDEDIGFKEFKEEIKPLFSNNSLNVLLNYHLIFAIKT